MQRQQQFGTFCVGPMWFCVEVECMQEVLPATPTTAVPLTTGVVDGLVNLRGQIVLAIDLRPTRDAGAVGE